MTLSRIARALRRAAGGGLAAASAWALAATPAAAPAPLSAADQEASVVAHLNAVLGWYHDAQGADGWIMQPSDEYYRNNQRDLTHKVLVSAFDYARAMVAVLGDEGPPAKASADDARQQRLTIRVATNTERLVKLHDQQAELKEKLAAAAPADRAALQAQGRVLQAQLDLDTALGDTLEKAISLFANSTETNDTASLAAHVSALQRTVPEVFNSRAPATAKPAPPAATTASQSGGLINRVTTLFALVRDQRAIESLIEKTAELHTAAMNLAEPVGTKLKAAMQAGDDASDKTAALTDPAQLDQARDRIEKLAVEFKSLSAALIPLREESMDLEQTRNNLADWKRSVHSDANVILRTLVVRAVALAIALVILIAISEIWRRATFKYVHDARRRRQFLVIRRFATTILMVLVIVMGFVSDFSSLATYAGLITAGIAVALQTIILSVAAYFFLVGRYGVRVGDRVTVSGVTGDVIDIGLVRVFLMELAGTGVDLHPTGRVVVLANSALFSNTPLYKQLPGTDYAWHELYVTMASDTDTAATEQLLLKAVNTVYGGYKSSIERQHGALERLVDYKTELPVPSCHVRLTDSAVEVVIRYPAEIRRMSEIDEQVTKEVLADLRGNEELRKTMATLPRIRSAVKS